MLSSSLEMYVTSIWSRDKNVSSICCVSMQEVSVLFSHVNSTVHEQQSYIINIFNGSWINSPLLESGYKVKAFLVQDGKGTRN
mgnify:CR=1 FL=1